MSGPPPFSVLELAYVPESHLHAVLNVDLTDANASMMSALFYTLECVCVCGQGKKNRPMMVEWGIGEKEASFTAEKGASYR